MVPVISSLLPSSLCHSQLRQTLRFTTVLLQTYLRPDIQLFGPLRARRTTIVALATLGITPVHYKRPPSGLHRLHWRGIENSLESASNTSRGKNGPDILTGALLATQNGRNIAVAPLAQTRDRCRVRSWALVWICQGLVLRPTHSKGKSTVVISRMTVGSVAAAARTASAARPNNNLTSDIDDRIALFLKIDV